MRRERPDYSRTPMTLLDPLFGWKPVNELFSDTGRLQRMLDFESALARAEARAGIIPAATASTISSHCRAQLFNFDVLARGAVDAGNLAIPMVRQLTELVSKENKDAARYVHWGATSQDAIDTGLVLQLRDALRLIAPNSNGSAPISPNSPNGTKPHRCPPAPGCSKPFPPSSGSRPPATSTHSPATAPVCANSVREPWCCNSAAPQEPWPASTTAASTWLKHSPRN